ncbi:Ubiquitin carboxyl-terminal hydrolase 12 [Sesamum alatum]|uniref:Ubiquitin carboxyl-terminal hydrolase 12 n=1 Tax=Sesamum alatum TaxID=300844 RepID=A0AAE1YQ12_9LAMI|nr:Ubiquitin carboxyl-terminal hydrolase 12 [Sesamum alatum]
MRQKLIWKFTVSGCRKKAPLVMCLRISGRRSNFLAQVQTQIYPGSDKISTINDNRWTLRAEEIPEEEKFLGPMVVRLCLISRLVCRTSCKYEMKSFQSGNLLLCRIVEQITWRIQILCSTISREAVFVFLGNNILDWYTLTITLEGLLQQISIAPYMTSL